MLTPNEVAGNDERFLWDFFSQPAMANQVMAEALINEWAAVPSDPGIPEADKPRVQSILTAKVFASWVEGIESVGKLVYAIATRSPDGIASRFVNGSVRDAERGLRLFLAPHTDAASVLCLHDPSTKSLIAAHSVDLALWCGIISRFAHAYFDTDPTGATLKGTYNAIKHGNLIALDPRTISVWPLTANPGHIFVVTRWPKSHESRSELNIVELPADPNQLKQLHMLATNASAILNNLSQLVLMILKAGLLTY